MGKNKGRFLDLVLDTIDQVQKRNQEDPTEKTAASTIFDIIREKVKDVQQQPKQQPQTETNSNGEPVITKKPSSIIDIILDRVLEAKQQNKDNPNEEDAPPKIFDVILEQVEKGRKKTAKKGLHEVVAEYDLDLTGLTKETLGKVRESYLEEKKVLNAKYAELLQKAVAYDRARAPKEEVVTASKAKAATTPKPNSKSRSGKAKTRIKISGGKNKA